MNLVAVLGIFALGACLGALVMGRLVNARRADDVLQVQVERHHEMQADLDDTAQIVDERLYPGSRR